MPKVGHTQGHTARVPIPSSDCCSSRPLATVVTVALGVLFVCLLTVTLVVHVKLAPQRAAAEQCRISGKCIVIDFSPVWDVAMGFATAVAGLCLLVASLHLYKLYRPPQAD